MRFAQATMYLDKGFTFEQVMESVGLSVDECIMVMERMAERNLRLATKKVKIVESLDTSVRKRKWQYDNPRYYK